MLGSYFDFEWKYLSSLKQKKERINMSETTTPAPAAQTPTTPTPQEAQTALTPVVQDIAATVKLVKQIVTDIKAQGATKALAADSPQILSAAMLGYADSKVAWPTIKAGYKTSEFWLVAGYLLMNAILLVFNVKIPIAVDVAIGSLISVYTVIRALVKGNAAQPVVQTVAPTTTN